MKPRVLGALVALGIAALVVMLVARAGDDGDGTAGPADDPAGTTVPDPFDAGTLQGAARELVERLNTSRQRAFHVRYRVEAAVMEAHQSIEIELWRRPPQVRQDTILHEGEDVSRLASFFLEDGVISCAQPGGEAWQCEPAPADQLPGPDALIDELIQQLAVIEVVARDEEVAGLASRCYELRIPDDPAELCVNEHGVPTRIQSGAARMELLMLADDVDEAVFVPPAA